MLKDEDLPENIIYILLIQSLCGETFKTLMPHYDMSQVRLSATVTCNQYYLLPCGADGAR